MARSIGASHLAPQGKAAADLGSHFASKAMGARSREPRAKIFARSANTLVPAKRRRIRFAFAARRSNIFCRAGVYSRRFVFLRLFSAGASPRPTIKRRACESSPKASTLVPAIIPREPLQSSRFYAILISERRWGYEEQ